MSSLQLLQQIWKRSDPGLIFLPVKNAVTGAWDEGEAYPPDTVTDDDFGFPFPFDLYFTPGTYVAPQRITENMTNLGVLYADLDANFDKRAVYQEITPSILWSTSPGRYQAVWFLDRPHPDAITLNRRLAYRLKADHGSWIPTKVLRVPLSTNWKRGGTFGLVEAYEPRTVYTPEWFDDKLPPLSEFESPCPDGGCPPVPTKEEHAALLQKVWPRLDHRTKQLLTTPQVADRSLHLVRLNNRMRKLGLSPQEIFQILSRLVTNKFANRPDVLWKSVVNSAS